jgi:hypothetical protein
VFVTEDRKYNAYPGTEEKIDIILLFDIRENSSQQLEEIIQNYCGKKVI